MSSPDSRKPGTDPQPDWEARKATNKRLGWVVGLIVLMIFLGTLWKYRPL